MVRYAEGDLPDAPAEALVNTVNEVGVMGKGIALIFRDASPESAREYQEACARREVRVGLVLVTRNRSLVGPRWIIHFPTKKHWRHRSRMEWVREGLRDLVRVVRENGIRSIALPPLGCGSGLRGAGSAGRSRLRSVVYGRSMSSSMTPARPLFGYRRRSVSSRRAPGAAGPGARP
jgi:O-acetyl-ADP-ribose deacetylase (regulator of RNase III)